MRLKTVGRLLGALCLAGSLTYAASGSASAGSPAGWSMTAVAITPTVDSNSSAVYQVTIYNAGPSNISSLFLKSTASGVVYLSGANASSCQGTTSTPLSCSFGALNAGTATNPTSVTVTVGFTPSGSSFDPQFYASTTGASPNDQKKSSHGDFLFPTSAPLTTVTSSSDFGGGFVLHHGSLVSDNTTLGNKNHQYTQIITAADNLVATVEDGSGITGQGSQPYTCPSTNNCYGEWSRIHVRTVPNYAAGSETVSAFKVTLVIQASQFPSNTSTSSIKLVHLLDDGTSVTLTQAISCGTNPTSSSVIDHCLDVKKNGNASYTLTTWLTQNGGMKGMT